MSDSKSLFIIKYNGWKVMAVASTLEKAKRLAVKASSAADPIHKMTIQQVETIDELVTYSALYVYNDRLKNWLK